MESRLENCPVRQIENATTLQTKVCHDSKLGKLNFCKFQMCSDRHGSKRARRWDLLEMGIGSLDAEEEEEHFPKPLCHLVLKLTNQIF